MSRFGARKNAVREGWPTDQLRFHVPPLPSRRSLFQCRVNEEYSPGVLQILNKFGYELV